MLCSARKIPQKAFVASKWGNIVFTTNCQAVELDLVLVKFLAWVDTAQERWISGQGQFKADYNYNQLRLQSHFIYIHATSCNVSFDRNKQMSSFSVAQSSNMRCCCHISKQEHMSMCEAVIWVPVQNNLAAVCPSSVRFIAIERESVSPKR